MDGTPQIHIAPTETELQKLRQALAKRYPCSQNVLGAQLGAFVRQQLDSSDLKGRFGGLKNFVTRHLPTEIVWRGKKGLDDIYDVRFDSGPVLGDAAWQAVPEEPAPWLWSAVTNPSTLVQFAWSSGERALMRSASGVETAEGLTSVQKLSRADYKEIARSFVAAMPDGGTSRYLQAIETSESSVQFTTLMREDGLLSKWEEFRVQNAVRVFVDRLVAAGAEVEVASRWGEVLRASQQAARSQRLQGSSGEPREQKRRPFTRASLEGDWMENRAVAARTLEYLSETELSELRLPLGSVMRAIRSLLATR